MKRRAKIVATLGPSSEDARTLRRLVRAGVNVIRLNLSHGDLEWHRQVIARVREVARAEDSHVPVLLDLMGPRYRLGALPRPVALRRGQRLTFGTLKSGADIPIDNSAFLRHLRPKERVLIDNGLVELNIVETKGQQVVARVVSGGTVSARKGINLPDSDLPFSVSAKDRAGIELAVAESVDYLAASYVGRARDIKKLRTLVKKAAGAIPIVAKLERGRAVEHVDEIVIEADAVMVARGDLGVEVPLHRVPVLQKKIIDAGRRYGKPVIVATQMLESMMERPRPTRAEASDVANAVFDGADALMLSGETAAGRYPVEAVTTMARIVIEAESHGRATRRRHRADAPQSRSRPSRPLSTEKRKEQTSAGAEINPFEIADVVAASAVFATRNLDVRQIVAFSQGGFTARVIARYRPSAPIVMLTTESSVARRVQLVWGVEPLLLDGQVDSHDEVVELVDRELIKHKLARPGEAIVILMGHPIRSRPATNLMRIHRVRKLAR